MTHLDVHLISKLHIDVRSLTFRLTLYVFCLIVRLVLKSKSERDKKMSNNKIKATKFSQIQTIDCSNKTLLYLHL